MSVSDDGRGIFNRLAQRVGLADAHEAAELMSRHANARSTDFPAARLALLGMNFERFEIVSSGVSLTHYAASDSWSIGA